MEPTGGADLNQIDPPSHVIKDKSKKILESIILSRTEEPAKGGTCARDRRALQQLALNMHAKH